MSLDIQTLPSSSATDTHHTAAAAAVNDSATTSALDASTSDESDAELRLAAERAHVSREPDLDSMSSAVVLEDHHDPSADQADTQHNETATSSEDEEAEYEEGTQTVQARQQHDDSNDSQTDEDQDDGDVDETQAADDSVADLNGVAGQRNARLSNALAGAALPAFPTYKDSINSQTSGGEADDDHDTEEDEEDGDDQHGASRDPDSPQLAGDTNADNTTASKRVSFSGSKPSSLPVLASPSPSKAQKSPPAVRSSTEKNSLPPLGKSNSPANKTQAHKAPPQHKQPPQGHLKTSPRKQAKARQAGPPRDYKPTRNKIVRVSIMINRNLNVPKREVMLDPRRTPNMDAFMDQITQQLEPEFGLVRRLHDAETGDEIKNIKDIDEKHLYVACGLKRFRKLDYLNVNTYRQRGDQPAPKPKEPHNDIRAEAQFLNKIDRALQIVVVHSGDHTGNHVKMTLTKRERPSWVKVLETITQKMSHIIKYDVKQLYRLSDGREITRVEQLRDLKNGGVYVAVDQPPLVMPEVTVSSEGTVQPKPTKPNNAKRRPKKSKANGHATGVRGSRRSYHGRGGLQREMSMFHTDSYQKAFSTLIEQKATMALRLLVEELCAEVIMEWLEEVEQNAQRLRAGLHEHIAATDGPPLTRRFDSLIPNIIEFVLHPEQGRWETEQGNATELFVQALQAAAQGQLRHWEADPKALAALLVLYDQFPRSMFDDRQMFLLDDHAYRAVMDGVQSGVVDKMDPTHRIFVCFVLTHQENKDAQAMCVEQWDMIREEFASDSASEETTKLFQTNKDIIERFGRFPDRNELLGRQTTDEENKYMTSLKRRRPSVLKRASHGMLNALRRRGSKKS